MKQNLILLLLFTVISSCMPEIIRISSKLEKTEQLKDCQEINHLINNHFFYLPRQDYYILHAPSPLSTLLLDEQKCVIGLDKGQIEKLFGKPSYSSEKRIYYRLVDKKEVNTIRYMCLAFLLEEQKVKEVNYGLCKKYKIK